PTPVGQRGEGRIRPQRKPGPRPGVERFGRLAAIADVRVLDGKLIGTVNLEVGRVTRTAMILDTRLDVSGGTAGWIRKLLVQPWRRVLRHSVTRGFGHPRT